MKLRLVCSLILILILILIYFDLFFNAAVLREACHLQKITAFECVCSRCRTSQVLPRDVSAPRADLQPVVVK